MCTWYSVFHKLIIYILTLWCRSYSTFYKRTNSAYYFTDFNKVIYFLLQDVLLSVKIIFFTQFSNMCLKLFMKYLHVPILWINVRYDISLFSCHDFLDSKKRNFFSGILNPSRCVDSARMVSETGFYVNNDWNLEEKWQAHAVSSNLLQYLCCKLVDSLIASNFPCCFSYGAQYTFCTRIYPTLFTFYMSMFFRLIINNS